MGAVTGLLGTGGGASGTGFAAPSGTNPQQLQTAYNQTQQGLADQQAFANALNPGSLQAMQSQQDLLAQLGQGAQGKGPNPALAQLNQTTGQNAANQAALMAAQRGSGQNAGMIARQAAHQGAGLQQQATGQAATLAAQQQLQQQQALQAQQQAMVNQRQSGLNAYNQFANQQQGNLLGAQASVNNANANLAGSTMKGQQNMLGGIMGGLGSVGQLFGGGGSAAAGAGGTAMAGGAGDLMSSGGGEMLGEGASLAAAEGGKIEMAEGGAPILAQPTVPLAGAPMTGSAPILDAANNTPYSDGPQSNVGKHFSDPVSGVFGGLGKSMFGKPEGGIGGGLGGGAVGDFAGNVANMYTRPGKLTGFLGQGIAQNTGGLGKALNFADGGKVPAMVSPGEKYLSPNDVKKVEKGANPMEVGEKIPGKPKVKGAKNDYANDTVPKTLEEGGIVLPRSVTQAKHPHWAAHAFVSAIMAKNGKMPKKDK